MNIFRLATALVGAAALAGCGRSTDPTTVSTSPQAYVRYVNASPDSPGLTVRFVDKVENWRSADGLAFRGNSGWYVAVNAGQRNLRAFRLFSAGALDTATAVVLDTTFTLQPQTYYTIVQTGTVLPSRGQPGNTARVTVFTDTVPSSANIAATSIAVRVYNALAGAGPIDVSAAVSTASATQPAAGTIASVPFGGRSAYVTLPAIAQTDTTLYRFTATLSGNTTSLATGRPATFLGLPASPASISSPALNAVAGVRLGGSALAVVVYPAAVAGSPAATATTAVPTVDLFPDNKP